jgi:hypothetical protein
MDLHTHNDVPSSLARDKGEGCRGIRNMGNATLQFLFLIHHEYLKYNILSKILWEEQNHQEETNIYAQDNKT